MNSPDLRALPHNRWQLLLAALLLCLGLSPCCAWAWQAPAGSPLARQQHPRLLVTPDQAGQLAQATHRLPYRSLQRLALAKPSPGMQNSNLKFQAIIASYVALSEASAGRDPGPYLEAALQIGTGHLARAFFDPGNGWDAALSRANIITGLAFVYDWCYPLLQDGQRRALREALLGNLRKMQSNYEGRAVPPAAAPWSVHNAYHNLYFLDKGVFLLGMAAVGLDDPAQAGVKGLLDKAESYKTALVEALNTAQKNGAGWQEGWHYFFDSEGVLRWMPLELACWGSATGAPVFAEAGALSGMALHLIYARKPDGALDRGEEARSGSELNDFQRAPLLLLSWAYRDGYFRYLADSLRGFPVPATPAEGFLALLELIFEPGAPEAKTRAEITALPPTFFAQAQGTAYFRSGWGRDDLFASFRSKPLYNNHQNAENNSFNIYFKGDLVGKSGYYLGWDAPHTMGYLRKSISANTVLVDYPGEKSGWGTSVGGQLVPGYSISGTPPVPYGSTRFEDAPHYALAVGDASRAYDPRQLSQFLRSFLYLKGLNAFVVHDKVIAAQADCRKRWLLHSIAEPVLYRGGERVSAGMAAGVASFAAVDASVVENGGGRLTARFLFPERVLLTKVGGPGFQFWNANAQPAQSAQPTQMVKNGQLLKRYEIAGAWRIEVSPAEPAREDIFLTLLDITEARGGAVGQPAEAERITASTRNGRGIYLKKAGTACAVVFGDSAGTRSIAYRCPSGPASHLVANLVPLGRYRVSQERDSFSVSLVEQGGLPASENGVLEFESR